MFDHTLSSPGPPGEVAAQQTEGVLKKAMGNGEEAMGEEKKEKPPPPHFDRHLPRKPGGGEKDGVLVWN